MSDPVQAIPYGMFIMPFHDPAKPLARCYDEDLELIVRAEELGFAEFWIGEHHTMKYENIFSPEVFIGRALGETRRIRLGPAPALINLHHPATLACRLACLDHLAQGRLNLCFGPSSVPSDYELYLADPKNAAEMVQEALDMILYLWTSEPPYEREGKYWTIRLKRSVDVETGVGFLPKPLQRPHPPIAMPGMSRGSATMRLAGARGFQPFAHCIITGNVIADLWKTYADAARSAGRQPRRADLRVARAIFLADTTAEAIRRVRGNSLRKNFEYIGRLFDKGGGRKLYKRDLAMSEADCNFDYLMTEQIIAGDPDQALRRLLALAEETGPFGTLVLMSYDWDDKQSWVHSMELFARELMPALNKALCGAPAPATA
jgi:alkanesulfonate monooxygenase SsuD/methylene tetrahydromethanopterin reductase-like flavin-dependent oxidoreductase (luciferase family)